MTVRHGSGGPAKILNLCFHGIGSPARALEPDEKFYWLETAQFEEFLDVIAGYPSVRITFDDGNASDVAVALPALRRRGLEAAFFVIAERMGQPGSLSAADVRSLARQRMTIGSHGMRHVSWPSVSGTGLNEELVVAARAIAGAAGQAVRQVACPYGCYDRRVLHAIRRHGFSRVYTVDGGPARADAWLQSRYTVRAADRAEDLERLARQPRGNTREAAVRSAKSLVKRWR